MRITADSHVDHNLPERVIALILERFADRESFAIESFELPPELGTVPCALVGPLSGCGVVAEPEVFYLRRGERPGESRMVRRAFVRSRTVTVIMGTHDGECILFTAYGGPCAPREPWDPSLSPVEKQESIAFWEQHALATGEP